MVLCGCVLAPPFRSSIRSMEYIKCTTPLQRTWEWEWLVIFYFMDVFCAIYKIICAPQPNLHLIVSHLSKLRELLQRRKKNTLRPNQNCQRPGQAETEDCQLRLAPNHVSYLTWTKGCTQWAIFTVRLRHRSARDHISVRAGNKNLASAFLHRDQRPTSTDSSTEVCTDILSSEHKPKPKSARVVFSSAGNTTTRWYRYHTEHNLQGWKLWATSRKSRLYAL